MQEVRSHPIKRLLLLVGNPFQVLFHSPHRVLFTFPSRTSSLSVMYEYLGLEGGPPMFRQITRVPPYSSPSTSVSHTGLSPAMATLSRVFCYLNERHWPGPRSLATTNGISVDVFSSATEMFQFTGFASRNLCIQLRDT